MNQSQRNYVRALYKEANVSGIIDSIKNAATSLGDKAVKFAKDNEDTLIRGGIDAGSALTMMGLGKLKDMSQGKKTTLLDYLTRGGFGVALGEAGQWGWRKYKDLEKTFNNTVETMTNEHANTVKGYEDQLDIQNAEHAAVLEQERENNAKAIAALKAEHDKTLNARDTKYAEDLVKLHTDYDNQISLLNKDIAKTQEALKTMTANRDNVQANLNTTTEKLNSKRGAHDAALEKLKALEEQVRQLNQLKAAWGEIKSPSKAWKRLINKSTTPPANENIHENPYLNIQGIGL